MGNKKKLVLSISSILTAITFASEYAIIIDPKESNFVVDVWNTKFLHSEWKNIGELYNCNEDFIYESNTAYKETICKQNQERTYAEYSVNSVDPSNKKLINLISTENKTIDKKESVEVSYASLSSLNGLSIDEGDTGITEVSLKLTLNKAYDVPMSYTYNTQDESTSSVLDSVSNLVYDEFGNPFVSVVDNVNGGRLIFDGGFPKYYNTYWNNATDFSGLKTQFKFMHNIIKWISDTHSSRGQVLIYGDAIENHNYSVHESASSDFNKSISETVNISGFTPVIKEASHTDFNGSKSNNRKVDLTLEEMNKYSSIIVMSSGGWESLSSEAANNFTTYVNNGGGVYIITDHDYFQKTGNQILRKFGSEFYGVVNRTGGHSAYKMSTIWNNLSGTAYDSNHALWAGLSSDDYLPAGGSEGNVRLFTPQTDIIAKTETLTFSPGETEKIFKISINGDKVKENDEVFKVMIQASNSLSHVRDEHVATDIKINDDD